MFSDAKHLYIASQIPSITQHDAVQTIANFHVRKNLCVKYYIFTALHVMQTRYCDENSVCPSVRPSVCHTREL